MLLSNKTKLFKSFLVLGVGACCLSSCGAYPVGFYDDTYLDKMGLTHLKHPNNLISENITGGYYYAIVENTSDALEFIGRVYERVKTSNKILYYGAIKEKNLYDLVNYINSYSIYQEEDIEQYQNKTNEYTFVYTMTEFGPYHDYLITPYAATICYFDEVKTVKGKDVKYNLFMSLNQESNSEYLKIVDQELSKDISILEVDQVQSNSLINSFDNTNSLLDKNIYNEDFYLSNQAIVAYFNGIKNVNYTLKNVLIINRKIEITLIKGEQSNIDNSTQAYGVSFGLSNDVLSNITEINISIEE